MSVFRFCCPSCKQEIEADEAIRGQRATCPCCNQEIVVEKLYFLENNDKQIKNGANFDSELKMTNEEPILKNPKPSSKNKYAVFMVVLATLFSLLIVIELGFMAYKQKQEKERKQVEKLRLAKEKEEFYKLLANFAVYGHELRAKSSLGISFQEFSDIFAKLVARWGFLCEKVSVEHKGRISINKAIKAWEICNTIWRLKLKDNSSDLLSKDNLSRDDLIFLVDEILHIKLSDFPYLGYDTWISKLLTFSSKQYTEGYEQLSLYMQGNN